MRITIAGGNSFIGKRLIHILSSNDNYDITTVIRTGSNSRLYFENRYGHIRICECDLENYDKLGYIVGEGDCFIDLSWEGSRGSARMDHELQRFNYDCTMKAMQSMIDAGYEILISSGSQAEYGLINDSISEETEPHPNTEYGIYKLKIFEDTLKLAENHKLRFIEPRYFSLYGPDDYEKTLIMACLKKMIDNQDIVLNSCTQLWDYMYVDDAVYALIGLIENHNAFGAFNFATGKSRPIRDFIIDMRDTVGGSSNIFFDDKQDYGGMIINLRADVSKLLKMCSGWKPSTSFPQGIIKTLASLKD